MTHVIYLLIIEAPFHTLNLRYVANFKSPLDAVNVEILTHKKF